MPGARHRPGKVARLDATARSRRQKVPTNPPAPARLNRRHGAGPAPTDQGRHRHRGTFTDVVAFDEDTGELVTTKTPSTPANPADGFIAGIEKILGVLGADRRRHHRGLPRHHRRDEQAARGEGRAARLHHHRGLRVHARDRPAGRARRLRQLLLLGQAAADRRGRPRAHRRGPDGLRGPRAASVRRGGCRGRRALVPRPRHHHDRRELPALLRQRRARAGDARGAAPRAPGGRGLDQRGGAARVPRVRAVDDHPRRRRRQAERQPLRQRTSTPASTASPVAGRSPSTS